MISTTKAASALHVWVRAFEVFLSPFPHDEDSNQHFFSTNDKSSGRDLGRSHSLSMNPRKTSLYARGLGVTLNMVTFI